MVSPKIAVYFQTLTVSLTLHIYTAANKFLTTASCQVWDTNYFCNTHPNSRFNFCSILRVASLFRFLHQRPECISCVHCFFITLILSCNRLQDCFSMLWPDVQNSVIFLTGKVSWNVVIIRVIHKPLSELLSLEYMSLNYNFACCFVWV
jgi:hypothetical protein